MRPGLTDAEIDRLAEPLGHLVLPLDLRVLYGWHNGHDPRACADGSYSDEMFLSLEDALSQYSMWSEAHDMWNPAWFPAFGDQSGVFVTLGQGASKMSGPLWRFHYQHPEISTAYDSVLALVETSTAMWRSADRSDLGYLAHDPLAARAEHNP